jgi:toxin CcdB
MAQFDIHRNLNPDTRRLFPYLLDVQSDLLAPMATRVVVPLARANALGRPVERLNPRFTVERADVVMDTPEIAGVPARMLGEVVDSAAIRRADIVAALDFLFFGV